MHQYLFNLPQDSESIFWKNWNNWYKSFLLCPSIHAISNTTLSDGKSPPTSSPVPTRTMNDTRGLGSVSPCPEALLFEVLSMQQTSEPLKSPENEDGSTAFVPVSFSVPLIDSSPSCWQSVSFLHDVTLSCTVLCLSLSRRFLLWFAQVFSEASHRKTTLVFDWSTSSSVFMFT